jgi:S-adenosylmethionine decarboxylase
MSEMSPGEEWVVDASGCDPSTLSSGERLQGLFDSMIEGLDLHPVAPAAWHQFPGPGGWTGYVLLAESHLAVHTFPEHGTLCLNLFCCRPRPEWAYEAELSRRFGARAVSVRRVERTTA